MPKFYDELGEASLENLASDPSNLPEGRVWKNSTSQLPKVAIGGAVKELITNDATQTLTNKTISGASNTITNVSGSNVVNTPSGNLAATDVQAALNELQSDIDTRATSSALTTHTSATTSVHGISDTSDLLTTANAKVVTNKDIDGGTASNTSRITVPKDTLANLQALTRKEGTIVYATDTDKFYADNGTDLVAIGSGSGTKNYFTNGDAEGPNPFTLFNDGSGVWVDGTGGAHTSTVTQSATTPLAGQKSFIFTSGTQYDTAKASITIDREDKYKLLTLELSYETASGTYADGDLEVYLRDTTNNQTLVPSPVSSVYASGTNQKQNFYFQMSDSLTYEILIHQKTSATFTMRFEAKIGPQVVAGYSPVSTDPVEFDSSAGVFIKAVTTDPAYGTIVRNEGRYSHNAGMTYYSWEYEQSDNTGASNGSGTYLIKLPYKMDLTKYGVAQNFTDTGLAQSVTVDGDGSAYYAGGDNIYRVVFYVYDEQHLVALLRSTTGTYNWWSSSFFQFSPGAPALKFQYHIKVHTLGLSAETKEISEYDGRQISASYYVSSNYTPSSNVPVDFDSKIFDSHNAVATGVGSWVFSAPISGVYDLECTMTLTGSSCNVYVTKNGSDYAYLFTADSSIKSGSLQIQLNAGDTVSIEQTTGTTILAGSAPYYTHISISLNSGAQQITAGERIYADYSTNAGQSIPNTTATIVDFEDKTDDSHSSVTTGGSFKFTAQRNDLYTVSACIQASAANYSNIDLELRIYKNGTFYRSLGKFNRESTGATIDPTVCGTLKIKLAVGDYIDARAYQANGAAINLSTASEYNWFQVTSGVV